MALITYVSAQTLFLLADADSSLHFCVLVYIKQTAYMLHTWYSCCRRAVNGVGGFDICVCMLANQGLKL